MHAPMQVYVVIVQPPTMQAGPWPSLWLQPQLQAIAQLPEAGAQLPEDLLQLQPGLANSTEPITRLQPGPANSTEPIKRTQILQGRLGTPGQPANSDEPGSSPALPAPDPAAPTHQQTNRQTRSTNALLCLTKISSNKQTNKERN